MESIGSLLKGAREAKGFSVEQVARDTNIARRYIEAMESEDTSVFPGETYFIGFLRNYGEFLGLDPNKLIGLFRNLKIQEQPPPMEELLEKPKSKALPIVLVALLLGIIGAGWYFFGDTLFPQRGELSPAVVEALVIEEEDLVAGKTFEFRDEMLEQGFGVGDVVVVPVGDKDFSFVVKKAAPPVEIVLGDKSKFLPLGEGAIVDLSGDGVGDLKIFPRQYLDAEQKVVLYLDKYIESADPVVRITEEPSTESAVIAEEPAGEIVPAGLGSTSVPDRKAKEIILLEKDSPEAFDLDVVFRGLCLLRYVVDNEVREERYFHKSEVFKLEVDKELRLWISNAGSFKGKIQGVDIPLGSPGEVSTQLIRWERQGTGTYQLKLIPMY